MTQASYEAAVWSAAVNEISFFVALAAFAAFILWVLITEFMKWRWLRANMDYRLKMLERLLSNSAVLEGESGARLLSDLASLDKSGWAPDRREGALHIGVISCSISIGLFVLALLNSFGARDSFTALAVMAAFLGAGFLVAAHLLRGRNVAPPPGES